MRLIGEGPGMRHSEKSEVGEGGRRWSHLYSDDRSGEVKTS
jgi:hypothetical protein